MTYSLINKCAKNYYNRTFIVQVIAKNVVTCFFLRHSVYSRLDFAGNRRIAIPVVERIVEFVKYSVAYCCDSYKQSEMKQSSVEGRILL